MRIFSTFTGIGGFEIGIRNAYRNTIGGGKASPSTNKGQGLQSTKGKDTRPSEGLSGERPANFTYERPLFIGYSEIDKYAISVYRRNFNGTPNYGDITKINATELPDFDCLVGGFPCQAFSIAGKRRGFEDTRGTLFFDLARILKAKTPRLFVFENVKGLLSHDNGNTFKTIIAAIDELGYDCQWQVLNSKNHRVPQNRERIIIVGHLRGTPRPEVFPISGTDNKDIVQLNHPTHSNDRIYDQDGISPTLNTMQGGNRQPFVASFNRNDGLGKELDNAHTLSSSDFRGLNRNQNQNAVVEPPKIRRLTPVECERLQAFPDDWTKYGEDEHGVRVPISDTQRYKMCGNAVTTNVIRDVFDKILNV